MRKATITRLDDVTYSLDIKDGPHFIGERWWIEQNAKLMGLIQLYQQFFSDTPVICAHSFSHYVGLTHEYDYCTQCDHKVYAQV